MATYQDYFARTNQNVYKSKKVYFPKPELYVVFIGERKTKPEYISLSEEFFDGEECFIDAKVKVLYGTNEDDVISQYVMFTKIYKAMVAMLKNAMEDFDVDAADEIMEQMKSYSYPPEIEALLPELAAAVTNLDPDEAGDIMDRMEALME